LGAKYVNAYGNNYLGLIDDLSIWNEALAPASISQLANGASPTSLIPEPASMALLAAGAVLMLRRRA
jgi:hypothetical protein